MATFPCPDSLTGCDCSEFPVRNFTQAAPDQVVFIGTYDQPPTVGTFFAPGCVSECTSTVSQAEADECAARQAIECSGDDVPPPLPAPPDIETNTLQTCTVNCPDGTSFSASVLAGTVKSFWQGDANARALGLACQRATAKRVCFLTDAILESICRDAAGIVTFEAFGGTEPYVYAHTGGTLPNGMTFDGNGILSGTPTVAGAFTFTLMVQDDIGSTQSKEFTLNIVAITSPTALPDGTQGAAYSYTLLHSGTTSPVSWVHVSGDFPDGLLLDLATGILSSDVDGITESGDFSFRLRVKDGRGAECEKDFTLEIIGSHPLEYWKLDEAAGNRAGSINGIDMIPSGAVGSDTGIIGNAFKWTSNSVILETAHVAGLNCTGSRSVSGWYRLDVRADGGPHQIFLWSFFGGADNLVVYLVLGTSTNQFSMQIVNTLGAIKTLAVPYVIVPGEWYFFHVSYNVDTGKISFEVNNVDQGTSTGTIAMNASVTGAFGVFSAFVGAGNEWRVDEITVRDYLPDAAELAAFYNGGAGHSWPL